MRRTEPPERATRAHPLAELLVRLGLLGRARGGAAFSERRPEARGASDGRGLTSSVRSWERRTFVCPGDAGRKSSVRRFTRRVSSRKREARNMLGKKMSLVLVAITLLATGSLVGQLRQPAPASAAAADNSAAIERVLPNPCRPNVRGGVSPTTVDDHLVEQHQGFLGHGCANTGDLATVEPGKTNLWLQAICLTMAATSTRAYSAPSQLPS